MGQKRRIFITVTTKRDFLFAFFYCPRGRARHQLLAIEKAGEPLRLVMVGEGYGEVDLDELVEDEEEERLTSLEAISCTSMDGSFDAR